MPPHYLRIGEKDIILLGTAHISRASVDQVQQLILDETPDVVGVELDDLRLRQLVSGQKWENTNILHLVQRGESGLVLLNLFLANLQKQLGEQVGVKPGEEMLVAVRIAQEKKIPILLMDRSVQITMKRALKVLSLWEKMKLGGSLAMGLFMGGEGLDAQKIEELKEDDLLNKLMHQLSKEYPKLKRTLVDERDMHIAHALIHAPGKKIVGIVGAGHVEGILLHLRAHQEKKEWPIPIEELNRVPEDRPNLLLTWGIPILFLGILMYLLLQEGFTSSFQFIAFWVIGHGILAGLGALIAGGHWQTVLGVVATAWLAALHPLIAAGWIAAALETKRHSPTVKDFTQLNTLNSIGDFQKNRVTKILLITVLTNIGSMLATFAVIPYLIGVLG
ncbi:MAG: TraB/GumN family protein [Candidatus Diapherotrites archaeon]|nr:TraB/GumN family protein [Candidatus Diapherotrites archaeon]MDZ4256230.1 TraB/GumN family protein [archaeon]